VKLEDERDNEIEEQAGSEGEDSSLSPAEERVELAEERTEKAEERTDWAEERTEWAEERTEWAQHRTLLANERNFSAWLRTGMSAMGGGIAIAELLGGEDSHIFVRIMGIILVTLGASTCAVAFWRFNQISEVLEREGLPVTPKWAAGLLAGGLLLVAIFLLMLIILQ
jgi:putative membrane protein